MLPENEHLQKLFKLIFPVEIIEHFSLRKIEINRNIVHIHLYEESTSNTSSNDFQLPLIVTDFPLRDNELLLHLYQLKQPTGQTNFFAKNPEILTGNIFTSQFADFIRNNENIRLSSPEMDTVLKAKHQYQRLKDYCNELEQEKGTLLDRIDFLEKQIKDSERKE